MKNKRFTINQDNCKNVLGEVREKLIFNRLSKAIGEGASFREDLNFLIGFMKAFEKRYRKILK